MTPAHAKELLPIITAFANGEKIQSKNKGDYDWSTASDPEWHPHKEYRIKPKPHLRPWTHTECPQCFVVQNMTDRHMVRIAIKQYGYDHVRFWHMDGNIGHERYSFSDLADGWLRIDEHGSEHPCGVMEEGE